MDSDYDELREIWMREARQEAAQANPLHGYCRRVYFERTNCRYRSGSKKGKARKRTSREVELLMFLPSRRCVQVNDLRTPGLDALAEEVFSQLRLPPQSNPSQVFMEYFRKLE